VLAALGVGVLIVVAVVALADDDDAEPIAHPAGRVIQPSEPTGPRGLGPVTFPGDPRAVRLVAAGVCHSYEGTVVPCSGEHHSEDYGTFSITGTLIHSSGGRSTDASNETWQVINQTCDFLFVQYTGLALDDPRYGRFTTAGGASIDPPIQDVTCVLMRPPAETLTGSARQ
jgi:hypothetical protein